VTGTCPSVPMSNTTLVIHCLIAGLLTVGTISVDEALTNLISFYCLSFVLSRPVAVSDVDPMQPSRRCCASLCLFLFAFICSLKVKCSERLKILSGAW